MGSKKYPEENYFASFISRNGGYTNATTRDEATTYNFAVSAEKLKEALDIWAQVQIFITFIKLINLISLTIKGFDSEKSRF